MPHTYCRFRPAPRRGHLNPARLSPLQIEIAIEIGIVVEALTDCDDFDFDFDSDADFNELASFCRRDLFVIQRT